MGMLHVVTVTLEDAAGSVRATPMQAFTDEADARRTVQDRNRVLGAVVECRVVDAKGEVAMTVRELLSGLGITKIGHHVVSMQGPDESLIHIPKLRSV